MLLALCNSAICFSAPAASARESVAIFAWRVDSARYARDRRHDTVEAMAPAIATAALATGAHCTKFTAAIVANSPRTCQRLRRSWRFVGHLYWGEGVRRLRLTP